MSVRGDESADIIGHLGITQMTVLRFCFDLQNATRRTVGLQNATNKMPTSRMPSVKMPDSKM
jgi:ABC-type nitrate/sulfonate/bicarbonate transport system ATPase subunit